MSTFQKLQKRYQGSILKMVPVLALQHTETLPFTPEGQIVYNRGLHLLLYPNGLSALNIETRLGFTLLRFFKKLN